MPQNIAYGKPIRKAQMARKVGSEAAIRARMALAPGLDSEAAHRLAGLLEAESHLAIAPNNRDGWRCACAVALRDDDAGILSGFRNRLGIGRLNAIRARNGSRPQVSWIVDSKAECAALVDLPGPRRSCGTPALTYWKGSISSSPAGCSAGRSANSKRGAQAHRRWHRPRSCV